MKKKKLSTVDTGSISALIGVSAGAIKQNSSHLNDIYDNVFVMYTQNSDDYPRMVKPYKWTPLQAGGEVAQGVVAVEGGKVLVVAPTQAPSTLFWSSSNASGGGVMTADRLVAMDDWAGKANTASQIAASTGEFVTNTDSYAPGFCNLYSRQNANGLGLTAGRWWLPSVGELMMMYANMQKINYALSFIANSTPLVEGGYWSSTEGGATPSWSLSFLTGYLYRYNKSTYQLNVRPVSAFIV
jgi:hypothetical protein